MKPLEQELGGSGHQARALERTEREDRFAETRNGSNALAIFLRGHRVGHLHDWQQVAVLNVESSRVEQWHKPGLLLIGDAAHVMSPVGGVGIQYAVQDAVETANQLTEPLRRGAVSDEQLAAVQRRRERSVRLAQKLQGFMQEHIVSQALRPERPCERATHCAKGRHRSPSWASAISDSMSFCQR